MFEAGLAASIGILALLLLAIMAGWAIGLYNSLVQLRENCDKAFKNIDVLLQQRHDEIPKLLDVCKGYMAHESQLFESIAELRSRFDNAKSSQHKVDAENLLQAALVTLIGRAEAYPELKSAEQVLNFQKRISETETAISQRREFFNDSVNVHNIYIQKFPQLLIARNLGFTQRSYLKISEAEKADAA